MKKIHVLVAADKDPAAAFSSKKTAHVQAELTGAIAVIAVPLDSEQFTAEDLVRSAADRASAKWPRPWEGGSHLMRYLGAAVRHADSQWKVKPDVDIDGLRINPDDASEAIKMAGALLRFIDQVGAVELARVAGLETLLPASMRPKTAEEVARGLADHFINTGQMG